MIVAPSGLMYHGPTPAFERASGPRNARIALVGEAFGEQEDIVKKPFIGTSGQELTRMLAEAGIKRSDCFLTNVFSFRPPSNNLDHLCGSKSDVGGKTYTTTLLKQGKYIRPEFFGEIERLGQELCEVRPNLVIALGATACWALLGSGRIGALRGAISEGLPVYGGDAEGVGSQRSLVLGGNAVQLAGAGVRLKVLPTYHPSAVMRNWAYRTIVVADLMKAKRELEYPEVRRPQRFVLVRPTLAEIAEWFDRYASGAEYMAVDIETAKGQIKNIGFAVSRTHAINIPFTNAKVTQRFWSTLEDEVLAWGWVKRFCASPAKKIFQNGLYDLQYLFKMGIVVANCDEDTMLLHHSLFPEMQKGLGFLGSIYTNEPAWKLMRGKGEPEKADDE